MLKKIGLYAVLLFSVFALFGCGDLPESETGKSLSSLTIAPSSASVAVGSSLSFSAIANYSDGTTAPVNATWSASNNLGSITTSGYTGIFVASKEGTCSVIASYGGMSALASITVTAQIITNPGGLVTIEVSPTGLHSPIGVTQEFTAAGKNGSGESIPILPAWIMTGDPIGNFTWSGTVATLEATGEGFAVISCTSGEVIGYTYVTIEGHAIDITVESDTYVDELNPSVSYEGETTFKAGYSSTAPSNHYEAYLRFSLASIPTGVSIEDVVVKLYPTSTVTPSLQLYKLNGAFSAATCWTNKPTYGSFIMATTFTAAKYNSLSADDLSAAVRAWYADPASNYGLALRQDGADNGVATFLSKENGSNPPMLSIWYK